MDADRLTHYTRITDGLRALVDRAIELDAPADVLATIAGDVERLAAVFADQPRKRPLPQYSGPVDGDLNTILPFSPVSGRFNALAAPVVFRQDGAKVIGEVTFGIAYEGPPQCVHGSVIASVYDQLLAFASIATHRPGPTASLAVRFRRPTPLYVPLRFESWVDRVDGKKTYAVGACFAAGERVSEADAMFISKVIGRP